MTPLEPDAAAAYVGWGLSFGKLGKSIAARAATAAIGYYGLTVLATAEF
jgi:hypothetical protein